METTKKQFIDEFLENKDKQGFKILDIENIEDDIKIVNEIWLEYLYYVCPQVAIYEDQNIIDSMRKRTPLLFMLNRITNKTNKWRTKHLK